MHKTIRCILRDKVNSSQKVKKVMKVSKNLFIKKVLTGVRVGVQVIAGVLAGLVYMNIGNTEADICH